MAIWWSFLAWMIAWSGITVRKDSNLGIRIWIGLGVASVLVLDSKVSRRVRVPVLEAVPDPLNYHNYSIRSILSHCVPYFHYCLFKLYFGPHYGLYKQFGCLHTIYRAVRRDSASFLVHTVLDVNRDWVVDLWSLGWPLSDEAMKWSESKRVGQRHANTMPVFSYFIATTMGRPEGHGPLFCLLHHNIRYLGACCWLVRVWPRRPKYPKLTFYSLGALGPLATNMFLLAWEVLEYNMCSSTVFGLGILQCLLLYAARPSTNLAC